MFRRLFAKESPFWGFIVGVGLALAVLFLSGLPIVGRLENVFLDLRFKYRDPIEESPEIVHIDIDDNSIETLGPPPWPRSHHAAVARMLHQLGAAEVIFDITFNRPAPSEETPFDVPTGRFGLRKSDLEFETAMRSSDTVLVSYTLDIEGWLPDDMQAAIPRIANALDRDAGMSDGRLASISGLTLDRFNERKASLRRAGLAEAIRLRRPQGPPDYARVLGLMIPLEKQTPSVLRDFQGAWDQVMAELALPAAGARPAEEQLPGTIDSTLAAPPMLEYVEASRACGTVNAIHDDDGILRRAPLFIRYRDRVYPHMGFQAVSTWYGLKDSGHAISVDQGAGGLPHLRVRKGQTIIHDAVIRSDGQSRILVNWPGSRTPGRAGWGFPRYSYAKLYSLWEQRYRDLQRELKDHLDQVKPEYQENLKRDFPAVFASSPYDAGAEAFPRQQMELAKASAARKKEEIDRLEEAVKSDHPRKDLFKAELQKQRAKYAKLKSLIDAVEKDELDLRKRVSGKMCFIGSAATGSGDLHSTPMASNVPGVNTLSAVANMLMTDQFLVELAPGLNRFMALLLGLFTSVVCAVSRPRISMTFSALLLMGTLAAAYFLFNVSGVVIAVASPVLTIAITYAGVVTYREITEFRARRKLENELVGQTHPEIVRRVLEQPELLNTPRKHVGTLFFSDLAGFTSISETMDEEQLTIFINRCHELVSDHIVESKGFVDKFMGDGVMAVFGVLGEDDRHARSACVAALNSIASIKELNKDLLRQKLPSVSLRIGINTGELVTGMVGSPTRRNFTAMGDSVNVAARFEPLNKMYGSTILIGPETRRLVGDEFLVRELDLIRVKGRSVPLPVFELICASAVAGNRREKVAVYTDALAVFRSRRWGDAIEAFGSYLEKFGPDGAVQLYLSRSIAFNDKPPPENWDAAFDMGFK